VAGRDPLRHPDDPAWTDRAPDTARVRLETTRGPVEIELIRDWAPRGVDRFYQLIRHGFYDDQRIFRVRAGFIAQFGIPGDSVLAAIWRHRSMLDDPVRTGNVRGTLAYAMTGPDTRTTQIYINLADNTPLDAQGFAPIGRVVEGMDVVDRFFAGYGEDAGGGMRRGRQDSLFSGGNRYLDRMFPRLDRIRHARVVR